MLGIIFASIYIISNNTIDTLTAETIAGSVSRLLKRGNTDPAEVTMTQCQNVSVIQ